MKYIFNVFLLAFLISIGLFTISKVAYSAGEITDATATEITETGAKITWTTTDFRDSRVNYQPANNDGSFPGTYSLASTSICPGSSSGFTQQHCVVVSSLSPGRKYFYQAVSNVVGGSQVSQPATSNNQNFTTAGNPPIEADTQSPSTPTGLNAATSNTSPTNRIDLIWNASTDNVGVSGYDIYRNDVYIKTVTTTSTEDSGLSSSTTYTYKVRAKDAAGNVSGFSGSDSATTSSSGTQQPDNTSPTQPTSVSATAASPTSINLSWTASFDAIGVTGYDIYRVSGTGTNLSYSYLASSSTNSYVDTGLSASTTYSYAVRAKDAAGNVSSYSSTVSATTPGVPQSGDAQVPSIPSGISATVNSSTSITISWTASTDNVGVSGYYLYSGGDSYIANVTSTSYTHTGLTASTTYTYKVKAYDAAGNTSEYSSVASATTSSSITNQNNVSTPSTPTNLGAEVISDTSVRLTWSASTSGGSSINYLVYRNSAKIAETTSTTYTDTTAAASTTYSYQVAAQNAVGTSSLTPAVSVTTLTSIVFLQGKVVYPDGSAASGALISIWANNATASATAGSNGEFSFQIVRNTTWRLSAAKTVGTTGYKSNDITVTVNNATVSDVQIYLSQIPVFIPPPTFIQRPVTERITSILTNGATIDIPPFAVTATGNVTLNVRPTVEVHEYSTSQVVGVAYDITIRDQAGAEVRTFAQPFDLTFPFDDATLLSLGVGADNLVPSFYNETLTKWVPLTMFTIDKVNKRVIAKVSHLTRFALIAAADVTAPGSPTLVTATQTSAGVVIRWVNPVSDFRHAKIYRSTENGKLGTVLFGEVAGTTQTDTSAAAGGTYYYVVRSVDPAGNESTNTAQVAVGASASSSGAVSTSGLRRYLRVGMSGADVKLIQQIMVREGVYVEGFTTGYFGRLTQKAAIKFQEKYRAEILTPAGLTAGNGYVGPKTLQKFIELKAKYSL